MSKAQLTASLALWRRRERYRQRKLDIYHAKNDKRGIAKWDRLHDEAVRMVHRRLDQLAAKKAMRLRAHDYALTLLGVMEVGGNNVGPKVSAIIRANAGIPGEAWCGDFMAYVYRHVGSRAVTRAWASVFFLGLVAGVRRTAHPQTGDLVRFTFDHVGMFEKDNGNGTITTIEGNTGRVGAVSDSRTGGDGVYRKVRSKVLVRDYLHVSR